MRDYFSWCKFRIRNFAHKNFEKLSSMRTSSSSHAPDQINLSLHIKKKICWSIRLRRVCGVLLPECRYM